MRSRDRAYFNGSAPLPSPHSSVVRRGDHRRHGNGFLAVETGLVVGILDASGIAVKTKNTLVQGWRIKNRFDCGFAILSFIVFVLLEAALVYSYFILVRVL